MNEKEYKKIKDCVKKYCREKHIKFDDAKMEDLSHEVICYRLKYSKRSTQSYQQSVIDCLRKQSGRKGFSGYDTRKELQKPSMLDDGNQFSGLAGPDLVERGDIGKLTRFLCESDRIIIGLIYKWGFLETEIADIFNVSPGRISQRVKRIQSRLSARIEAQKSRAEGKRKKTVEELLQEKTERLEWRLESFSDQRMETGKSW